MGSTNSRRLFICIGGALPPLVTAGRKDERSQVHGRPQDNLSHPWNFLVSRLSSSHFLDNASETLRGKSGAAICALRSARPSRVRSSEARRVSCPSKAVPATRW